MHLLVFFMLMVPCAFDAQLPPEMPPIDTQSSEVFGPTADDSAPGFIIATGQITDVIGAGQKNALVTAFLKNADGSAGKQIAQTKTDAMGDFSLAAQESPGNVEILVRFSKEQFTDLTKIFEFDEDRPVPFLGDALEGNLGLSGKVLSAADKNPVAAAKVTFENMFTRRDVETGAEGRFEIRGLSPGQGELEITAEGFGRERKVVRVPVAEEILVELKPERSVHLTVTDRGGTPLAGAVLECIDSARHDVRTLITGDDGTALLRGLHYDAQTLAVRLTRDGYVATQEVAESLSLSGEGLESRHQLFMEKAATISGHVLDAHSQSPLYGARVFAGDEYSDLAPRDWTHSDGRFSLTSVRPGVTHVTVHFSGRAPDLKSVDARPGETTTVDFELKEAAVIRGTVKSKEGEPVAGVEVAATQWRGQKTLGLRAMTDRDGRFELENAPADEFTLTVHGAGVPVTRTVKAGEEPQFEVVVESGLYRRQAVLPGKAAPDLTVKTLDGEAISLSALKGKTVLLVFWATWCAPCVAEVPRLIEVHERFRGRNDFLMIGVSRDFDETELRSFLKSKSRMAWPQAFGEQGGANAAVEAFGVTGIPAIFLIDSDGKVAAADLRDEQITQEVEKILGAKANP